MYEVGLHKGKEGGDYQNRWHSNLQTHQPNLNTLFLYRMKSNIGKHLKPNWQPPLLPMPQNWLLQWNLHENLPSQTTPCAPNSKPNWPRQHPHCKHTSEMLSCSV